MKAAKQGVLLLVLLSCSFVGANTGATPPVAISTLLKPLAYKRVLEEREVAVHASLSSLESSSESSLDALGGPSKNQELKKYSYYVAMLVRANAKTTRRVLTDYQLYAKMIPYVERAAFNPSTQVLEIEGGIFKYRLSSQVRFEEKGERWIQYRFVGGHFQGMTGKIYFEPHGEKGTLVHMSGVQTGTGWPPKFVIERGAEIVFEFTAKRMRSFIESQK